MLDASKNKYMLDAFFTSIIKCSSTISVKKLKPLSNKVSYDLEEGKVANATNISHFHHA